MSVIYYIDYQNRRYIGQTKVPLKYRISGHLTPSKSNGSPFKGLSIDQITYGIIEEVEEDLLEREDYWIEKYDTIKNGWNSIKTWKSFTIYNSEGKVETTNELSEYCKERGLSTGHLSEILSGKRKHHKGYFIIPTTKEEIETYYQTRKEKENTIKTKGRPGSQNGRSKLNWDIVNQIREHYWTGKKTRKELSIMFNIGIGSIDKIVNNQQWVVDT